MGGPSHLTGELSFPHKASPVSAYFLPYSALSHSLLGISPLIRPHGVAIFTPTSVKIFDKTDSPIPFLSGTKSSNSDLWFFSAPQPHILPSPSTALFSLSSLPLARFVAYHYRSFGSPSISTFFRALSRDYIHGIPQLTPKLVRKFPLLSLATSYGHLDTLRQGVASIRRVPPSTCLSLLSLPTCLLADIALPSISITLHKDQWSSADLTGRFPVRSSQGYEYILVVIHRGYIYLTPLKSHTSSSYVAAFASVVPFFKALLHPLTHLLLDNETSNDLTLFFKTSFISYQYVPPNNHRSLPAERGICTSKNHIIAVLSSCHHVSFPSNHWPDLFSLIEFNLNHLRP